MKTVNGWILTVVTSETMTRAADRGVHPELFPGAHIPGGPRGAHKEGNFFFLNFPLLTPEFDLEALLDPRMSFMGP